MEGSCAMSVDAISAKLVQAIKENDLETFKATLPTAVSGEINKSHEYLDSYTYLEWSINKGMKNFIACLLNAGAEVKKFNPDLKTTPIHLAMKNNQPDILELLLRFGADVNQRAGEGRTPLHILVEQWGKIDVEIWDKYFELLQSNSAIDILNVKNNAGTTPVELAIKRKLEPVVTKLLPPNTPISQKIQNAVEKYLPNLREKYPKVVVSNNDPDVITSDYLSELWNSLRIEKNEHRFQSLLKTIDTCSVGVNLSVSTSDHNPTLLQYACKWQIPWAVSFLLAAKVDPNQTSINNNTPPLIEAVMNGNVEIVQKLVSHQGIRLDIVLKLDDRTGETVLHKIALKLKSSTSAEQKLHYAKCLEILISECRSRDPLFNVNGQDQFGNTALHYAALSGVDGAVYQLLRGGAKLTIKNKLAETATQLIMPSTLESFMDSCIRRKDGEDASSQNFGITFDYSFLAPPTTDEPEPSSGTRTKDIEMRKVEEGHNNDGENKFIDHETLWHLSTSPKHQYLLKHPLITSFLTLKWHSIHLSRYLYTYNAAYFITISILIAYILCLHSGYKQADMLERFTFAYWFFLIILVILSSIEILLSTWVVRRTLKMKCLNKAPNIMFKFCAKIGLIACAIAVVFTKDPSSLRNVSAVVVLLACGEGLFLLGRHPKLSIFVIMFTNVLKNFVWLLSCFAVVLIGFAFSFFVVFGGVSNPTNITEVEADFNETPYSNRTVFVNIPVSLLKVVAMMTGELEYGSFPFEAGFSFPMIIFFIFLFFIAIVFWNLINALAIDDTQDIRSKAEIVDYKLRLELISRFEFIPCSTPSLFDKILKDNTFTVYSTKKSKVCGCQQENCNHKATFQLDEDIFQNARQKVLENSNQDKMAQILTKVENLQSDLRDMKNEHSKLYQLLQDTRPTPTINLPQ